uniref:Uncharacterized protein n=1 Tax=Anguilla anguilla TaxID=7936 RepID=A0A0E9RVB8_ANGAN
MISSLHYPYYFSFVMARKSNSTLMSHPLTPVHSL